MDAGPRKRLLPRFAGHHRGVETVRVTVRACLERGIEYLTLFAFSSENWRRPPEEVSLLMQLFVRALKEEVKKLDRNGVRLRVIGDLARFDPDLQALIRPRSNARRATAA
jgi:undecaprenyl diphosphate synthase